MLKEQWYQCTVTVEVWGCQFTTITTTFQSFEEDHNSFYDAEGNSYLKELCKEYK